MTKHTPTPWKLDKVYGIKSDFDDDLIASTYCEPNPQRNQANAQFIVTACNSHDELVDILERLMTEIELMDTAGYLPDGKSNHLLNLSGLAQQALSKAGAK